ncbi:glycosyltransferase family 2 protein [Paracoccus sp. R86501]|uniref:glycosyltransferase family 2 protein n=1 Tax=Paracoccus sp. R86501 TaxID=3101711 RepID=UPI003671649C
MIRDAFRQFKHRRRIARALAEIRARPQGHGRPHGLPSELIVSLTSYAARFGTLEHTLQAITRQTVQPDRVILWLDEGDRDALPDAIRQMPAVQVAFCPDWRSYKKIVPTLLDHPDAHVVTADDDVYYPADWLEGLVTAVHDGARIACHRAHRVVMSGAAPAPYDDWQHNITAPEELPLVFQTGVSGVIYAPGSLHRDVTRDDLFTRLAPSADDVWLYWMARLAGSQPRKIGPKARILEWEGSQTTNLRHDNRQGSGNDRAIAALMGHYGWPE